MLDIYKYHETPDQLDGYAEYQEREAAKKEARIALHRLPNLPDASEAYLNALQEIQEFIDFNKPDDFHLEVFERAVDGHRVASYSVWHPRGHEHDETAFKVDVVDGAEGIKIKLYDIDDNHRVTDEYDTSDEVFEDGEIFNALEGVVGHYNEYV